ncbi:MAG: AI-2E family transporter [Pseudomonadota bacterium]|nr:AI-2E family transporter [Pseudomonadota bacterium]
MNSPQLQRAVFLLLLTMATLAFFWVLSPFFGAVFWAIIMALLFQSLYRTILRRTKGRSNMAALLTLTVCVVIVVLPAVALTSTLVNEAAALVDRVRGGDVNFGAYAQQVMAALPQWLRDLMARFELVDLQSVLNRFSDGLIKTGQLLTTRALSIGQNALMFIVNLVIMLYLLFFFLRDGDQITRMIRDTVPMSRAQTQYLMEKFATVVRATVKGNVVIAIIQGTLGGLAFWALGIHGAVLWGVVMAILSLLPAVGASLVWGPVAVYLLATGSVWQGVVLALWGGVVIGLSDNALRPILVGRDTKLPDYVVLLTTIGGLSLFGISGFVIGPTIAALFIACWALFKRSQATEEAGY